MLSGRQRVQGMKRKMAGGEREWTMDQSRVARTWPRSCSGQGHPAVSKRSSGVGMGLEWAQGRVGMQMVWPVARASGAAVISWLSFGGGEDARQSHGARWRPGDALSRRSCCSRASVHSQHGRPAAASGQDAAPPARWPPGRERDPID